jgi:formylglycine-generating enzyme required for sulfatase activity
LSHAQPATAPPAEPPTQPIVAEASDVRTIRVPGTTVSFDLVRTPASDDGSIPPMWVLRTEVPWELYDIFTYRLDQPEAESADAIARPSKPYVPPDRGFGHQGYPAMGMTRHGAEGFCAWLSDATGIQFRLPTATEWTHLAGPTPDDLEAAAWTADNANHTTHPVARRSPNPHGLHDTLGNVAEWVMTDTRRPVAMGGSYREPASECRPDATMEQDRSWNASEPLVAGRLLLGRLPLRLHRHHPAGHHP